MPLLLALLAACRDASLTATNADPEADIVAPAADEPVVEGTFVTARGTAADANDANSNLLAAWYLDGAELCPAAAPDDGGVTECTFTMPGQDVLLTLEVHDPKGASARAERTVVAVPTAAPTALLVAPTADATLSADQPVTLQAVVADAEDAADTLQVVWTSSIDGILAGADVPTAEGLVSGEVVLSAGTQELTVTVTDSSGKTGTDSVSVVVAPAAASPTCNLDAPDDGALVVEGDDVEILASLGDPDGDARDLMVELRSDLDGVLDTTPPNRSGDYVLLTDSLSNGVHTLTVTATDPTGLTCSDSISVHVDGLPSAPTATIAPDPADTDADLTVTIVSEGVDPDGDPITYGYTWYRNGTVFSTAPTIAAADTSRGEIWRVLVTPNDGWFDGAHAEDSITIGNAAPVVATVDVTPASPRALVDDLTCAATATDADGDAVLINYEWTADGVPSGVGDRVPREALTAGSVWTCTATADDTTDVSTGSASVTIGACPEGQHAVCPGTSCAQLLADGASIGDGVYWIQPAASAPYEVRCDMTTDGGGWTLVATASDDGVDTWTYADRHRLDSSISALGSASTPTADHQSPAYAELPFTDLLFVHSSTTWAAYAAVGDGIDGLDEFVAALGEPSCQDVGDGWPMSAGTLVASGDLCSTDLYFNAKDRDGRSDCGGTGTKSDGYGPMWSGASNHGCPLDDTAQYGLGPNSDSTTSEFAGLGFGYALGLNTGTAGTGANWLQVYVR